MAVACVGCGQAHAQLGAAELQPVGGQAVQRCRGLAQVPEAPGSRWAGGSSWQLRARSAPVQAGVASAAGLWRGMAQVMVPHHDLLWVERVAWKQWHLGKVLGIVAQGDDELVVAHACSLGGVLVVMLGPLCRLQLSLQARGTGLLMHTSSRCGGGNPQRSCCHLKQQAT